MIHFNMLLQELRLHHAPVDQDTRPFQSSVSNKNHIKNVFLPGIKVDSLQDIMIIRKFTLQVRVATTLAMCPLQTVAKLATPSLPMHPTGHLYSPLFQSTHFNGVDLRSQLK